ncbi:hypothetical protein ABT297_36335 [Dactylosporangium sp. NPDC000555]
MRVADLLVAAGAFDVAVNALSWMRPLRITGLGPAAVALVLTGG